MAKDSFLGYEREDGSFGIRNHVLVLPLQRHLNMMAQKICESVRFTRPFIHLGDAGRPRYDRMVLKNVFVGLCLNPNTASVLILTNNLESGYEELKLANILKEINKSGKKVLVISVKDEVGYYNALGKGIELARELVVQASKCRRKEVGLKELIIGVKCGMSDATSGIAGNPVVGNVFDKIGRAGGKLFFSETTEVIGAEKILAKRAKNNEVANKLLQAVHLREEKAKSTGEDIRTINPIPENIAGGISTLEEKSLGAIIKSGSAIIEDVLQYAERPQNPGLYFVDAWMSVMSLPMSYAAAGCQLMIFQMGGSGVKGTKPTMPAFNTGLIMPIMYVTGNSSTYERAIDSMDFDSSGVLTKKLSIDQVGEQLLEKVIDVASGTKTKVEVMNFCDPLELLFEGPVF